MKKTILNPAAARTLVPALEGSRNAHVWVYRYSHPAGWRLSIATHAPPGSDKLSLGGFRIAPPERTSMEGFDSDVEAIELAMGMESKVYWSRLMEVGGPLARRDVKRIVGGKCVVHPGDDARVGKPRDRELLDWAIECLADCERTARIRIITGQDLGHGVMSDGRTTSLEYLNRGFPGCVMADTSKPTAEGNYYVLRGMLRPFGVSLDSAVIGLIGAGNVGMHMIERLRRDGSTLHVLELARERRAILTGLGITAVEPDAKAEFLRTPMDALVVNASGGTLDHASVETTAANPRLHVVCGSENLALTEPEDADAYRRAGKAFCPTELCGMMGYLTAVEEYLAHLQGIEFDLATLFEAARALEEPATRAASHAIASGFAVSFERAVENLYGGDLTRAAAKLS